jgi:hypothetical protein
VSLVLTPLTRHPAVPAPAWADETGLHEMAVHDLHAARATITVRPRAVPAPKLHTQQPGVLWACMGDAESMLWDAPAGRVVRRQFGVPQGADGEPALCRIDAMVDAGGLPLAWWQHQCGPARDPAALPLPYGIAHQSYYADDMGRESAMPFALYAEMFVDELAHQARRDPLDFRLAMLAPASRQRRALERAAQLGGWSTARGQQPPCGVALVQWGGLVVAMVGRLRDDGHGAGLVAVVDGRVEGDGDRALRALAALGTPMLNIEFTGGHDGMVRASASALQMAVLVASLASVANARAQRHGEG